MCNLSVGVWEQGRLEGRKEGRKEGRLDTLAAAVCDLKDSLSLTEAEAFDALRVPEGDRAAVSELVAIGDHQSEKRG